MLRHDICHARGVGGFGTHDMTETTENTRMKRILITGSSGLIGNHLVKSLAQNKKYKIFAVDKKKFNFRNFQNIYEINIDLKNQKLKFPKNIDTVIHLAAYNGTKFFYEKPLDVINDNILTTLNLINYSGLMGV